MRSSPDLRAGHHHAVAGRGERQVVLRGHRRGVGELRIDRDHGHAGRPAATTPGGSATGGATQVEVVERGQGLEGREARQRHATIMCHSLRRRRHDVRRRDGGPHDRDLAGASSRPDPEPGRHSRDRGSPRCQRAPARAHARGLPDGDPDGRRRHRDRPGVHQGRGAGRPARDRAERHHRRHRAPGVRRPVAHPVHRRAQGHRLVRRGLHAGRAQGPHGARADAGRPGRPTRRTTAARASPPSPRSWRWCTPSPCGAAGASA